MMKGMQQNKLIFNWIKSSLAFHHSLNGQKSAKKSVKYDFVTIKLAYLDIFFTNIVLHQLIILPFHQMKIIATGIFFRTNP